jgi:hypothetical protein
MEVPSGLASVLRIAGILLILFAVVDVVLARAFSIDITGVSWSPLAAGLAGIVMLKIFRVDDEH